MSDLLYLLHREHTNIGKLSMAWERPTGQFATTRILADDIVSRDGLRASPMQVVARCRDHSRLEEESFFPAARRSLTGSDWRDIEREFTDPGDPLFASGTSEHFMRPRFEVLQNDAAHGQRRQERMTAA